MAAVVLIARQISIADFGIYTFMVALTFILQRSADLGNDLYSHPGGVASHPQRTMELLSATLSLAWIVCAAATVLIDGMVLLTHMDRVVLLTALMSLAGLTQFHCNCYIAILVAREDNEIQALGFVLHKLFLLVTIWVALALRPVLEAVVTAYLLSAVFQWLILPPCGGGYMWKTPPERRYPAVEVPARRLASAWGHQRGAAVRRAGGHFDAGFFGRSARGRPLRRTLQTDCRLAVHSPGDDAGDFPPVFTGGRPRWLAR